MRHSCRLQDAELAEQAEAASQATVLREALQHATADRNLAQVRKLGGNTARGLLGGNKDLV